MITTSMKDWMPRARDCPAKRIRKPGHQSSCFGQAFAELNGRTPEDRHVVLLDRLLRQNLASDVFCLRCRQAHCDANRAGPCRRGHFPAPVDPANN